MCKASCKGGFTHTTSLKKGAGSAGSLGASQAQPVLPFKNNYLQTVIF